MPEICTIKEARVSRVSGCPYFVLDTPYGLLAYVAILFDADPSMPCRQIIDILGISTEDTTEIHQFVGRKLLCNVREDNELIGEQVYHFARILHIFEEVK